MSEFAGRVAFITGGASGLGRAAARQLAAAGASVVVADVQHDAARALAHELSAHGGQAMHCACDVRDDHAVGQAVTSSIELFGRLVIAIYAACMGGAEVRTA